MSLLGTITKGRRPRYIWALILRHRRRREKHTVLARPQSDLCRRRERH
jgi:hypothetical protein